MEKKADNLLDVELTEEVAQGIYSNLAVITHSNTEFILDFLRIMPGMPKAHVKSRIVLTPEHAKRFLRALEDNVRTYEASHGEIDSKDVPPLPMNFGGPTGQA
jgi:hypothetical protein